MLTATTGPQPTVFTTLANVQLELPSITDTSQDIYLTRLINRATAAIVQACKGRVFGLGTYSEVFDPQHFRRNNPEERETKLMLSRYPVTALSSITDTNGNILDPSLYYCDMAPAIIRTIDQPATTVTPLQPIYYWAYPLTVVYSAGYDFTSGPSSALADIEGVALQLIVEAYLRRGRDASIQLESTQNVGETRWFDRTNAPATSMYISPAQMATLQPYIGLRT